MLEPMSGFALACNVLQIVEYGAKILAKAAEYRGTADGTTVEQQNLSNVLQSLKGLNADIEASMPRPSHAKHLTTVETRLMTANEECLRLSNEFIQFLDRLKVSNKHSMLESLRMSIKSLWYKERLEATKGAVSQARDNLNIAFLIFMQDTNTSIGTEIMRSNSKNESSIIDKITSSTNSIEAEINSITTQLNNSGLDSIPDSLAEFRASNQDTLDHLSKQLNAMFVQQESLHGPIEQAQALAEVSAAQQKILDSLHFPQIHERRENIPKAHKDTYTWILRPSPPGQQHWDDFVQWAKSKGEHRKIYWINGKPGCGKTTLMRFLDESLQSDQDLLLWAEALPMIKARCFFWNPGESLQKSLSGLLRSLLYQLLEKTPNLIPKVVQTRKWRAARSTNVRVTEWSNPDILATIREFIALGAVNVLFLIDGLDEFEGTDEQREELVELLYGLASFENVKMCVSSRPWNIFNDAFTECPQLRLENLTYHDISRYVLEQLGSHRRFQHLLRHDPSKADLLVTGIVQKASGVFLWVRLVVKELLRGVRDGDGIRTLSRKLDEIPADLDAYFTRLMNSIEEQHQQEAATLLQLALHREHDFTALHPVRLLDLSFIEEKWPDFALETGYDFSDLDFGDVEEVRFRIDSTTRRLNSRCMGLLECQYNSGYLLVLLGLDDLPVSDKSGKIEECSTLQPLDNLRRQQVGENFVNAYALSVHFLHRSFRDFLATASIQERLQNHVGGTYDARLFFCSARLAQLKALHILEDEMQTRMAIALASSIISVIALPELRGTRWCAKIAQILHPVVERMMQAGGIWTGFWYLGASLESHQHECSTFLSVAVDFDLEAFVKAKLTSPVIANKQGRPLLDYIVRGRFAKFSDSLGIGNRYPNADLLSMVLRLGANPNQTWGGVSVWALFLCFLGDGISLSSPDDVDDVDDLPAVQKHDPEILIAHLNALTLLLEHGADPLLPKKWLSHKAEYFLYGSENPWDIIEDHLIRFKNASRNLPDLMFIKRWGPVSPCEVSENGDAMYAVADVLENLRDTYKEVENRLDQCISLAREKHGLSDPETSWSMRRN